MGAADLRYHHEKRLLQPVLQYRLRGFWGRLFRIPALARQYRAMGLPRREAWRLAALLLRSPVRLAKLHARWGQGARRRG